MVGLHHLLADRPAEAGKAFRAGFATASASGDVAAASRMQMLDCEASRRSQQTADAVRAWTQAVRQQASLTRERNTPLDAHFWRRAERLKPAGANWPAEVGALCSGATAKLGCRETAVAASQGDSRAIETAYWAALGAAELERKQPQLALVSFKRAEQSASPADKPWLRIAQARSLAGLGQYPSAMALLSVPMTSKDSALQAASTTTLASLKIQSGAYEQGASLLNRTLGRHAGVHWPGRLDAEADLALARLILGRTDEGLRALHRVQQLYSESGDWEALVTALENERDLLEYEKRSKETDQLKRRILEIERI